ncbi:competence protein CoiA [Cytobacillus pseudoceanisediminis]|uniref:competence protein CoiA n=1 Tax=Cytobacillus pseudoceanisediminis TaxID=3051614 RepID=UPI003C3028A3
MLRCITVDKETIIATQRDKERIEKLNSEKKLLCPNCNNRVVFKPGKVKTSHFAHYQSDCVVTNYEPETESHLKGKQILYEWLMKNYPSADIEYEQYILETNQIADIFVEHTEGELEGVRWAFEFQHSPLSSTDWEARHELYKSAGIQDFWILDKAKFMKFSTAKGISNARKRNDLEKAIFSKTGLCYFLDLKSSELTIDFSFVTSPHTTTVNGVKRTKEYTYHSPIHHSAHLNQVRVRINEEFMHGVLVFSKIEDQMENRLSTILSWLKKEQARKSKQELHKKAKEKILFARSKFGDEKAEIIRQFMKDNIDGLTDELRPTSVDENKEKFTNHVRLFSNEDFFTKYEPTFSKLCLNIKEFKKIEASNDLIHKLLNELTSESTLYSLSFVMEQGSQSLEEYLKTIHEEKIDIVSYIYHTYKKDLEKLASMNFKLIKRKLDKIRPYILIWGSAPTAIDYAISYRSLKTREAADEYMNQVKEQVIYWHPDSGIDW